MILNFNKTILFILFILLYSGCSNKKIITTSHIQQTNEMNDLKLLQQKPYVYTNKIKEIPSLKKDLLLKNFKENYFYPWHISKFTLTSKKARWGEMYSKKDVYSENLTKISKSWFDNIILDSNFQNFDTMRKKAITIHNSHLRVFPTISKIFYDPKKAGEGFPFDYNENSSIKINTPLFISHLSKNNLWAYVESSVASGWIQMRDIAYANKEFVKIFENNNYFINTKDNTNIYKNNALLTNVSLGTLFPKAKKGFIIAAKNYRNNAFIRVIDKNKAFLEIGIDFSLENITSISKELISQRYGWGGLLDNRDCSLMIKDFYAPFGIFLHRNSKRQKDDGKSFDISHLNNSQKKEYILKNAIPFQTLIYLQGHIMIYIGIKNNEPLVFHNIWGVKTVDKNGDFGRNIIGKAVVTTLSPGSELDNYVEQYSILSRIKSITMLTH